MNPILFHTTTWSNVPAMEHAGECGTSVWRTLQFHGFRVRLVEYSMNYKANHWCSIGHILYCIEGDLTTELADGRIFELTAGMSYQVSDNASTHRSASLKGARLLIIDGNFLRSNREAIYNPWKM